MVLQHHWFRPRPLSHEIKEFRDNGRTCGAGIKLADTTHQDGPSNAAWESEDIAVDATTLGPKLDGAKGVTECFGFGKKTQDLVGDSSAVDTAKICLIQTS